MGNEPAFAYGDGSPHHLKRSLPNYMNFNILICLYLDRFSDKQKVWTVLAHPLKK